MDRFTTKESPKAELIGCVYCLEHSNCYSNMSCSEVYNAFSKLRYYENLEEQGRLVTLPCKVGQKLYTVYCYGFGKYQVHEGTLCEIKMIDGFDFSFYEQRHDGWCYKIDTEEIGKTIFLTREEAEMKMTELINN